MIGRIQHKRGYHSDEVSLKHDRISLPKPSDQICQINLLAFDAES